MNQTIKTTIFSPYSDLQFKAGFDQPLNPQSDKDATIRRTGAVVFADGRKIDKDMNSQQNMSVQQFVPTNGYMPVQLVQRGLNVIESSLRATRPDMTPFQIRNRPKYQLDPALDKYTDQVFDTAIAPTLSLLDDDRLVYQQYKMSTGMFSRGINVLPLTDQAADKVNKVARWIENDSRVFKGQPARGSIRDLGPEWEKPDLSGVPIDMGNTSRLTAFAHVDAAFQSMAASKNLDLDSYIDQIQEKELMNEGLGSLVLEKLFRPDGPLTFGKDLEKAAYHQNEARDAYDEYRDSDAFKHARQLANVRTKKMRQTGIPYYESVFGNVIERALRDLGKYGKHAGNAEVTLTAANTILTKDREKGPMHDAITVLRDHISQSEFNHFLQKSKIRFIDKTKANRSKYPASKEETEALAKKMGNRMVGKDRMEEILAQVEEELKVKEDEESKSMPPPQRRVEAARRTDTQLARPGAVSMKGFLGELKRQDRGYSEVDHSAQSMRDPNDSYDSYLERYYNRSQRLFNPALQNQALIMEAGEPYDPNNPTELQQEAIQQALNRGFAQGQEKAMKSNPFLYKPAQRSQSAGPRKYADDLEGDEFGEIADGVTARYKAERDENKHRRNRALKYLFAGISLFASGTLLGQAVGKEIPDLNGGLFGRNGRIGPTQLNSGNGTGSSRFVSNPNSDKAAGFNQSALFNNQVNAQTANAYGSAQGQRRRVFLPEDDAEIEDMGEPKRMVNTIHEDAAEQYEEKIKVEPPARVPDIKIDEPERQLQREVTKNVSEDVEIGQGGVKDPNAQVVNAQVEQWPGDQQVQLPLKQDNPLLGAGASDSLNDPNALRASNPIAQALYGAKGGTELLAQHAKAGQTIKDNQKLLSIAKEEEILQDRWGISKPLRALGLMDGGTFSGETRIRLGRFMGRKTQQDVDRLAALVWTDGRGVPINAEVIPTRVELEEMIQKFRDNTAVCNAVRATIKQTAERVFTLKGTIQRMMEQERQSRAAVINGTGDAAQLDTAVANRVEAEAAMDNFENVDIPNQLRMFGAATEQASEKDRGMDPKDLRTHIIKNSWTEWGADWGRAALDLLDVYTVVKSVVGVGALVGLGPIFLKITGVKFIASAVLGKLVPSLSAAASLGSLASQTGVPLSAVYTGWNALMHKVSGSGSKEVPSESSMMGFLADALVRCTGFMGAESFGLMGTAGSIVASGAVAALGFARSYLQPSVEKRVAAEVVEIQQAKDTSNRKTINILGKRYKKRPGQAAQMLTKKKRKKRS